MGLQGTMRCKVLCINVVLGITWYYALQGTSCARALWDQIVADFLSVEVLRWLKWRFNWFTLMVDSQTVINNSNTFTNLVEFCNPLNVRRIAEAY